MAIRFHIPRKAFVVRLLLHPVGLITIGLLTLIVVGGLVAFTAFYLKYVRLIDQKLAIGPFQSTSMIFAAPQPVNVGDELTAAEVVSHVQRCGYSENQKNKLGWYHLRDDAVEIFPGPDSYFDEEPGVIKFRGSKVSSIISLRDNTERTQYLLEPELITNLFDRNREKRRLIKFHDIPHVLVNAVVSIEDKRFFHHSGFDPLRVIKAAYVDVKEGRNAEGASTLTMQLARSLWLTTDRTWRRKLPEILITLHLEQELSKEQIFEYYANQIYLGQRGSFAIHGFGEGSQAYFDRDVQNLTLPEAALLAGIIQRPTYYNPYRYPDRARKRRDLVLSMMRENGYITETDYAKAVATPIQVAKGGIESTDAPYFVDLVNSELQRQFQDFDFQSGSYRVYTTLDMDLQRDAAEAVRTGLQEVDALLARQKRFRTGEMTQPAQLTLVAMDPETGAIKALVGGRNYGMSQLNHALARRQPGSIFKPLVYATAMNTALEGGSHVLTPSSTVVDEPTTFWFDDKPYEPANFKHELYGTVTLRYALAHSINIAAVKVAEMVGYDKVAALAREAGLGYGLHATPAIALGAYEATPIEMAGAYTIFANRGVWSKPNWIADVRDLNGKTLYTYQPVQKTVLDPRVDYIMVNLMEEVLRSGTGAGVRSRGFWLPSAGKTGTSHDGWFAGFTSKLLCVVWVGFDDNSELDLEGAKSALPIWTEFMKRAHQRRQYRMVKPFEAPQGIVSVDVDKVTGKLAAPSCGQSHPEVFIAGTEPSESCTSSSGPSTTHIASWESPAEPNTKIASSSAATPLPAPSHIPVSANTSAEKPPAPPSQGAKPPEKREKRKGVFGRILDIFK